MNCFPISTRLKLSAAEFPLLQHDNKHISRFFVGNISDLPTGRDSLASAMQQVDRTERVLKTLWKERHQPQAGWSEQYRVLEERSEQVRRTAHVILQNLLG